MTTLAVASDLHADETGSPDSFFTEGTSRAAWKAHPIEALCRLIAEKGLRADYLVCPGDFANHCSLPGLRLGWDAINELAAALSAIPIGTIGNHDVDSYNRYGDPDIFVHARRLGPTFPLGHPDHNDLFWRKGFVIIAGAEVGFLVLNSALHHSTPGEADHGKITHDLLDPLEDELNSTALPGLRIALVHHHPHLHEDLGLGAPDVMHGGQELISLLSRQGFQLVIHGHKHHPKLSYAAGGPASPVIFAAGSLSRINYGQLATNTRNLFHLVSMEPSVAADCTVFGSIKSWEFNCGLGWNPSTFQSAGFPFYAGFGCRQMSGQLAESAAGLVNERITWSEILRMTPCLSYALPSTREETILLLRDVHQIRTLRDEVGEPAELAGLAIIV